MDPKQRENKEKADRTALLIDNQGPPKLHAKCARTQTASAAGVMALSESFFEPLVAGDQKASLASLSP